MSELNTDMFLKISHVKGESKDKSYKETIAINSFSWGATQPGNMGSGGGGGAGKVIYHDLHINAFIDIATPTMLRFCSTGKHIDEVVLSVCKAGNAGSKFEYLTITLKEALITAMQYTGPGHNGQVGMIYTFQAAIVDQKYTEQTKDGGQGVGKNFGWNIKEGVEV